MNELGFFEMGFLELGILAPALAAALLVLASHVLLGRQVLERGIIFIDLAVAQAAATGALAAMLLMHDPANWLVQVFAGLAALAMVLLLHGFERWFPAIQEPLIGAGFVLMASTTLLLSAGSTQGGEHASNLLAGQILWTSSPDLLWLGLACAIALLMSLTIRHPLGRFYLPFAIAITSAVQVVGVYLVFACLIFPALACRQLSALKAWIIGMVIGAVACTGGLLLSLTLDLPSGPVLVITLAASALLYAVASRRAIRYNRPQPE